MENNERELKKMKDELEKLQKLLLQTTCCENKLLIESRMHLLTKCIGGSTLENVIREKNPVLVEGVTFNNVTELRLTDAGKDILRCILWRMKELHKCNISHSIDPRHIAVWTSRVSMDDYLYEADLLLLEDMYEKDNNLEGFSEPMLPLKADCKKLVDLIELMVGGRENVPKDVRYLVDKLKHCKSMGEAFHFHSCTWRPMQVVKMVESMSNLVRQGSKQVRYDINKSATSIPSSVAFGWDRKIPSNTVLEQVRDQFLKEIPSKINHDALLLMLFMRHLYNHAGQKKNVSVPSLKELEAALFVLYPDFLGKAVQYLADIVPLKYAINNMDFEGYNYIVQYR